MIISKHLRRFFNEISHAKTIGLEKSTQKLKIGFENSEKRIVKVTGIPINWEVAHIQKYFDPFITKIDKIIIGRSSVGTPNHKAYLTFKNSSEATKFIDSKHIDFINSSKDIEQIKVELLNPKRQETKIQVLNENRQVELYNLAFEVTNLDILKLVEPFGKIENIHLPMRSEQKNKGYCIINFENDGMANHFKEQVEGFKLFGRELKVKQKIFCFDTQKPRTESFSDMIIKKAETDEIRIKGALSEGIDKFMSEIQYDE